jgi:uncharacterized glyoxalase superfamily protein PhnB
VVIALLLNLFRATSTSEEKMTNTTVKRITPILFAREIEPCIKFWTEKMGFNKTVEVPEGSKLGFAILEKDGLELMYQSYASVEKDNAATADAVKKGPTFLYIDVDDLNRAMAATKGAEVVMPARSTFYGAKEFGIKDPVGHYIIFAQQGAATAP